MSRARPLQKNCIDASAPGELIGFSRAMHDFDRKKGEPVLRPALRTLAIHSALATLTALILSTRRRISVALIVSLRRVIPLRPALVPVAIAFAVAVLTFLAALLPTRILRTTLVRLARHVSIPTLLTSLIRLSHWSLLGRLRGRPTWSKLGAELISPLVDHSSSDHSLLVTPTSV